MASFRRTVSTQLTVFALDVFSHYFSRWHPLSTWWYPIPKLCHLIRICMSLLGIQFENLMAQTVSHYLYSSAKRQSHLVDTLSWRLTHSNEEMKIFRTIRKEFAIVGIGNPSNRSSQKWAFTKQIICGLLLCFTIVSQLLYIFYVANGFMENIEAICTFSASIIMVVGFLALVLKRKLLFKSIDKLEKLVVSSKSCFWTNVHAILDKIKSNKISFPKINQFWCVSGRKDPKSKAFFIKTDRQVEQLSKIVYTVVMKVAVQLILLPKCIVSFGTYFFTDSGSDSFELPFRLW